MDISLSQSEMNTLLDITFLFHSVRDVAIMSKKFLQMLGKIIPYESAVVFLRQASRQNLSPCAQIRCDPQMLQDYTEQFQNQDYLGWRIYQTDQKVFRESDLIPPQERNKTRFYQEFLCRYGMEYRLLLSAHSSAGELLGLVMLFRSTPLLDFSEKECFILELLQNHFSIGIENAFQFRKMSIWENRTKEVYRSLPEAIFVLDDQMNLKESNTAAEQFLDRIGEDPHRKDAFFQTIRACCKEVREGRNPAENTPDIQQVSVEDGVARIHMISQNDLKGPSSCEFIIIFSKQIKKDEVDMPHAAEEPYRTHFFETLSRQYSLTKREILLIRYALDGYENQQIAEALFISLFTVKSHFQNAYAKLGVKNRQELFLVYMRYIISETFRQSFDAQRRKDEYEW